MEIKTVGEFVNLVEAMRTAQNRYFRSRSPSVLSEARALEKAVDDSIKAYRQREADKKQSELFGV